MGLSSSDQGTGIPRRTRGLRSRNNRLGRSGVGNLTVGSPISDFPYAKNPGSRNKASTVSCVHIGYESAVVSALRV